MSRSSQAGRVAAFEQNQRIGKYEVLTPLSTGGMAELFLGFTAGPGGFRKYVVIKQILPDVKQEEEFVRMFLDEARITAAFNHPNIAQVFDLGEEEDGLFLAMEFIAGQNLNQITNAALKLERALPFGFSVAVARDVCLALHYAHTFTDPTGRASPVIHRDVAQKNVMVTYEGVVKLLDFGIAKARGSMGKTQAGMVKGTTGYMSPEQVRGQEIDGRSDVFSVGVMLHEMLTGRRLFSGRTELEEMQLVMTAPIPRPSQVNAMIPEELSDVVMRSLARERADRFASAKEMSRALDVISRQLSFDVDQRALFMRELFQEKMAATQALLEAAEGGETAAAAMKAARELRRDRGLVFPTPRMTPSQPDSQLLKRTMAERRDSQVEAQLQEVQSKAEAIPQQTEEPRRGWMYGLIVITALVLAAAAVKFVDRKALAAANEPVNKVSDGPPKAFMDKAPEHLPPLPVFGTQPPPPPPPLEEPEEEPEPPAQVKGSTKSLSKQGTLTLVTTPESDVFRGRQKLGRTPLFNVKLPKGTHLLTLESRDGTRLLSVPITPGKNSAFRVKLEDLPRQ